jgi:capping protein alpha
VVIQAIQAEEHMIQSHLEDMYINMSEETFKEMRRVMPVTQTKMDWSIHAHRTAKDLGRK